MDENTIRGIIKDEIQKNANANQYQVNMVPVHTHNGSDSVLIDTINLPTGTPIKFGLGGIVSASSGGLGAVNEQIQVSMVSGRDQTGTFSNTTKNLQINLLHQPQNVSNQSFINAFRPPVYGNIPNTTISVTSGGSTVTVVAQYGFTTNVLAGALINIINSSGSLVETQSIASNTSNVITINSTWINTTAGGTFFIYVPVFLGSADVPFQRLSVGGEDVSGGAFTRYRALRLGYGTTAGTQSVGIFYGTGTPETFVTANIGSLYLRTNGGAGTTLYVKESGSSNTGWISK